MRAPSDSIRRQFETASTSPALTTVPRSPHRCSMRIAPTPHLPSRWRQYVLLRMLPAPPPAVHPSTTEPSLSRYIARHPQPHAHYRRRRGRIRAWQRASQPARPGCEVTVRNLCEPNGRGGRRVVLIGRAHCLTRMQVLL